VFQTVQGYAATNRDVVPLGYRSGFKQFNSMVYSGTSKKFCLFGVFYLSKQMDPPDPFFCPSNQDPQSNLASETNPWPPGPRGVSAVNGYVGYGFRRTRRSGTRSSGTATAPSARCRRSPRSAPRPCWPT
jgi:hypothetical protein